MTVISIALLLLAAAALAAWRSRVRPVKSWTNGKFECIGIDCPPGWWEFGTDAPDKNHEQER